MIVTFPIGNVSPTVNALPTIILVVNALKQFYRFLEPFILIMNTTFKLCNLSFTLQDLFCWHSLSLNV